MIRRLFNLKIPSLLGILLLLGGVGVTSMLVDRGVIFEGRAAPDKTPTNIAITNVTPTEFTVMYTTTESVTGSLQYGTKEEGSSVAMDDRDQQTGRTTASTIHHITVRNLSPETTYFFSILSGGDLFKNNDAAYEVTTAPSLEGTPPEAKAITGSVIFPATLPKQDLLILFSSDTLQQRSALVAPDGSYTIPMTGIRTQDLSDYASLTESTTGNLVVLSPAAASHATVLLEHTDPVPLITFGQSYDFTLSTEPLTADATASGSAGQTFPQTAATGEGPAIQITSPDEAETFTDQQPVFSGKALPGENVDITIHSDQTTSATISVKADGTWQFRPPAPLNPGNHTITIKTRDLTGTLREFTRSFTVYAQGSQFIEPSVSPTRTPTPTLAAAEPTATETPEPTQAAPTATPTLTPETPTPTTAITGVPTPTAPPPVSGGGDIALGGILSLGTFLVGLALFFLTRGSLL